MADLGADLCLGLGMDEIDQPLPGDLMLRFVETGTAGRDPPLGTDAGHLHYFGGMEGIVCGPGGRYNTMPDERVDIVDYLDMIRVYMLAILDICEIA